MVILGRRERHVCIHTYLYMYSVSSNVDVEHITYATVTLMILLCCILFFPQLN